MRRTEAAANKGISMILVSFGGGTNSTAMLIGMQERGIRPDYITFADTGGEKPHTYEHIKDMDKWLKGVGFPTITVVKKVRRDGSILTLEDNCLEQNMLPSIAYGFKSCSLKYKVAPQDKFFNNNDDIRKLWKEGKRATKYIGYDYGESHRVKDYDDNKYKVEFPLVDWKWTREDCVKAIERSGLPQPMKSACFFCPSSKATEIREMAVLYPDLMDRCLTMEKNAHLTQVKGLGRNFAWSQLIATDDMFADSYIEPVCGCYDG